MMNQTVKNLIADLLSVDVEDVESVAEFRAKYSEIDTNDLQGYVYSETGCSLYVASSLIGDLFNVCDIENFIEDCAENKLAVDDVIDVADFVDCGVFGDGATLVDWSKFKKAK